MIEKKQNIFHIKNRSINVSVIHRKRKETKSVILTKMFHRNSSEVSQLDPFVFQGRLQQRVVLKDEVIWKDEGNLFRGRKRPKIAANNRSVAAYK